MWQWFHQLASPRWFYQASGKFLPWISVLGLFFISLGLLWGLGFAPQDAKQGNSFRIIYIHVPSSFLALAGYYIMAAAGAIAVIWKIKLADIVMKVAAPIGAAFTFVALLTGAIWGKPTWGTYWIWDARITSMLILFFLYLGVIILQRSYEHKGLSSKAAALLALVGTVNIPIIYKSVDWWYTLHQPATIKFTEAPSMHPDMFQPLLVMIIGFYFLYTIVLVSSIRVEILHRERRTKWVQDLVFENKNNNF